MMTKDATMRNQSDSGERFSIDPERPLEVVVNNVLGDITLRGTSEREARVWIDRSRSHDQSIAPNVQVEGNRIVVQTGFSRTFDLSGLTRGLFGRGKGEATIDVGDWAKEEAEWAEQAERGRRSGRGGWADILIEAPIGVVTHAKLRAASGEVTVSEITGSVEVSVASGEIQARHVAGDLTVQSASGDIGIDSFRGALTVRSASGDLHLRRADLDRYLIQTASGDIRLEDNRLTAAGPYRLHAVSGDIKLAHGLAPEVAARGVVVEFKSVSGDIRVAPPLTKAGRRRWEYGAVSDDSLSLGIRTVSGDVEVRITPDMIDSPAPPTLVPPSGSGDVGGGRDVHEAPIGAHWIDEDRPVPPIPPTPPTPPTPPGFGVMSEAIDAVSSVDAHLNEQMEKLDDQVAGALRAADAALLEIGWDLDRAGDQRPTSATDDSLPHDATDAANTETSDSPEATDRLAVLAALERGEIDVDEAMRRLGSTDDDRSADSAGSHNH